MKSPEPFSYHSFIDLSPSPKQPWIYLLSLDLPILGVSYKWILSYVVLCDQLFSLDIFSRFIHDVICIRTSFLFTAKEHPIVWINHISFMQSSTDKHLGCFHLWLLWIVLLWTFMNTFLLEHFFSILLSIYVRVELLSHMITQFNYLRNYQTVFP